jgi:bacillithiol system protein YtxJ
MWIPLSKIEDLTLIVEQSKIRPQAIFKHSTRCSISSVAKGRLERAGKSENFDLHYLDLIKYRDISNAIADQFDVQHESPQIIMIKDGKCVYDESHNGISMDEIEEQVIS